MITILSDSLLRSLFRDRSLATRWSRRPQHHGWQMRAICHRDSARGRYPSINAAAIPDSWTAHRPPLATCSDVIRETRCAIQPAT
jgi:hypothetical protein